MGHDCVHSKCMVGCAGTWIALFYLGYSKCFTPLPHLLTDDVASGAIGSSVSCSRTLPRTEHKPLGWETTTRTLRVGWCFAHLSLSVLSQTAVTPPIKTEYLVCVCVCCNSATLTIWTHTSTPYFNNPVNFKCFRAILWHLWLLQTHFVVT